MAKASRNALVTNYLMCVAKYRGDIDFDDKEDVSRLRNFLEFMSTGPSPEQVMKWQEDYPAKGGPSTLQQSHSAGARLKNIGEAEIKDNVFTGHDFGLDADTIKKLEMSGNVITRENVPREARLIIVAKYRSWLNEPLKTVAPERHVEMMARFTDLEQQILNAT